MELHTLLLFTIIVLSDAKNLPGQGDVVTFNKGKSQMIANGVKGFKSKGKFYKIMGYRGSQRLAFQKFEEERDFAEDINDHKTSEEEKLMEEEEEFFSYEKQKNIAANKGVDPQRVEIPRKAQQFQIQYGVGKSARRRRKKWSKRNKKNKKRRRRRGRTKRFALKDENRYWTNAVVPYIFTTDIKDDDIIGKLRAKRRFEYWTCIRFVPWTKDTKEEYGLDHNNYLKHINKDGCWSVLGNTKGNGQKISCCSDSACVHELGHSLGLQHEQKSPLHDEYLRVNNENIIKERLGEYQEDMKGDGRTFGYYDLGDQMHYKRFMFSKNSKPTMTLYDPQMEYLLLSSDPHNYYMFKEITEIYNCADTNCADFKQDCGTDGYIAYIRGRCQCRCPEGYDPYTACSTKYKGDPSLLKLKWPDEPFSMLKPKDGCPKGFKEGIIKQSVRGTGTSQIYHIDSENGMMYFTHKFCTKPKSPELENNAEWGRGQYCILSYGGSCPEGFKDGIVGFDNMQKPEVLTEPLPDSQVDKNLVLHYCCREDGSWKDPLLLPSKEAFVLFQKGDECQEVKDMMSSSEWFLIDNDFTGMDRIDGLTPEIEVIRGSKFYIGVCYYWPINYSCGGVIELTDSKKEVTISSPNFPSNYNIKQQCHWSIKSPKGSHMELDFQSFDIELREDDSCGDSLEVRTGLPGQLGINYCGDAFKPTVMSEGNYLGLIFTSGPEVTRRGFRAKVSIIQASSLCYTDKGFDYRGKTNVSRTFRPCLSWSDVQHCPHHTFNPQDLDDSLDENYCRNPGSGLRPWCYIHKDECLREYCDACHFEHCYDKFYDCYQLQQENAAFCHSDPSAKFGCRKSCGFCAKSHSNSVESARCRTPEDIPDAAPTKTLKPLYRVGENVTFKCKTGPEKEDRVCLSDGTWSGGGFICGRCPRGWVPFKEKCYIFFDVTENKTGANRLCGEHGAVVTPAKDPDELNFLLSLRKGVNLFWLGIDRLSKRGQHLWQEDDSAVTWTKWKKGKSNNCAFVDKNGQWIGTSCNSARYIAVICKFSPSERKICVDARFDCSRILEKEQSACMAYPDFAWHLCPQSCGVCHSGPEIKCFRPADGKNTVELTGAREVTVGRMFEYHCRKGYVHSEGNLRRVCLKSGKLSGDSPKCISEHDIPTANNAIELRQRRQDGRDGNAYVGLNDAQMIHKDGLLTSWMFYSIYDGEVALQVWRKPSGKRGKRIKLKLMGQTIVSSTKDHRVHNVTLAPKSRQVAVKEGDYIGFFLPTNNKGGITFDKCDSDIDGQYYGHQYSASGENTGKWKVGASYSFSKEKISCKKISLTAYVL